MGDPEVMLNFAIEIYWGFRVAANGVKIRVGVWHGDVTGHVGINFSGFIQYHGYSYEEVKKIEESTDESLALSASFYSLVEHLLHKIPISRAREGYPDVPIHKIDFKEKLR